MAVITESFAPSAPVGKGVSTKPIPFFMRLLKTSSKNQQAVVPKSRPLKPKDLNTVPTISVISRDASSQTSRIATKVPTNKQDQPTETKAFTMIKSPSQTKPLAQKLGLGNLFTDGGLEAVLIRVVSFLGNHELAPCLQVCKNSNAVMAKTSEIQVNLRSHLYGARISESPQNELEKLRILPRPVSSKHAVSILTNTQLRNELDTYSASSVSTVVVPIGSRVIDIFHETIMIDTERMCYLKKKGPGMRTHNVPRALSLSSTFTWCSQDTVVVEAQSNVSLSSLPERLVYTNFASHTNIENAETASKHPDAKFEQLITVLPPTGLTESEHDDIRVRLHPGGLLGVLLGEAHVCASCCSGATTRIVIIDWHHGTALGAIRVRDCHTRILDFQFLGERQVVCSSQRIINGVTYPCIDTYDLPQSTIPFEPQPRQLLSWAILLTFRLPSIPLAASYRFPPLQHSHLECVWSTRLNRSLPITDFTLKLPKPSREPTTQDRVMTFRLEGPVQGHDKEALQGTILLSRLHSSLQMAITNNSLALKTPVRPSRFCRESCVGAGRHLDWHVWSSAVSMEHSSSTVVFEPRGTQVARIAESIVHKHHAVMMIRDYNQQLLRAPTGHWNRNLGLFTENRVPIDNLQVPSRETFKVTNISKSLRSELFGKTVYYGLGHRTRAIELGAFGPNISSSKLFLDGELHMAVVSLTEDGREKLHSYNHYFPAPLDLCPCRECQDKMSAE